MVTDNERKQLLEAYQREPVSVAKLLLTCAAGLFIVVAMAWVGFDVHTYSADAPAQTSTAQMQRQTP